MEAINLNKIEGWLNPDSVTERIHIIGVGSVGSTIAELLARFGFTKISLYDMDTVESKNVHNQMFNALDIGKNKVAAEAEMLVNINPEIANYIKLYPNGYDNQRLSGYVFLCVDNIELRRKIAEENRSNLYIKGMFDVRTRLTDAQSYAADWSDEKHIEAFINSMQFSHEEATADTPVSACGIVLGVATTVRLISAYCVNNFVNFIKGNEIKKMIIMDAFNFNVDAF